MSYTFDVKKSLMEHSETRCCRIAELYGFLCFSKLFSRDMVQIITEHKEIIDYFIPVLIKICPDLKKIPFIIHGNSQRKYEFTINDKQLLSSLASQIGFYDYEHIDDTVLQKVCCKNAFLRGVFIACGFISDPDKTYRVEVTVRRVNFVQALIALYHEFRLTPRTSMRKGVTVLYIKSAEEIKNYLAVIGANGFIFDYVNVEIEKDIRNEINRTMNCENANMNKMILASELQAKAAQILKSKGYAGVPENLVEVAELRLNNRELSLEQLGQILQPPLSKSGVCHRMKKIIELAKRIE